MGTCVIAVDVGTGSARAGVYDRAGQRLGRGESPIALLRPDALLALHDSSNIWHAVSVAVRMALTQSGVAGADIAGLGFDATCSLVLSDQSGNAMPTMPETDSNWDTISWMDHRALSEAAALSQIDCAARNHAGGQFSPEMQIPKLKWIHDNHPDLWASLGRASDLSDWLVSRAIDRPVTSYNPAVTKWGFLGDEKTWDHTFLAAAGLGDLIKKLGLPQHPGMPGQIAGALAMEAAHALGLNAGIPVSYGMVDAFAGAVSLLGEREQAQSSVALIAGTSNCVMHQSGRPKFLSGYWGPYRDAVLPDHWVTEGGQSAAGALLDHVMRWQPHGPDDGLPTHENLIAGIEADLDRNPDWGSEIHVLPDFHGSRSPVSNPSALGVIHGLALDGSANAQRKLYWRTMVAIALGIRHIVEEFERVTGPITLVRLGGGHARNQLMTQLYADALARPVAIGPGDEAMLLGGAMVAATAAGWFATLTEAARAMGRPERMILPDAQSTARLDRDYRIRQRMLMHRDEIAGTNLTPG